MSLKDYIVQSNEKASAKFSTKEIEKIVKSKSPSQVLAEFRDAVKEAKDEKLVRKLIVCLYVFEKMGKIAFDKPDIVKTRLNLNISELQKLIDELNKQILIVKEALE
ncbi:MAG: hypothetical protein ACTSP4_13430 [Candidatus Hodarchaeales archaeon]